MDDNTYWLNDGHGHEQLVFSSEIHQLESYNPPYDYGGECPHVYYNRLQRDGWTLKNAVDKGQWNSETIFEKTVGKRWILRKICHEQVASPKRSEERRVGDEGRTR